MADLTNYKCFKNSKYQVLTNNGFRDFKGLIVGSNPSKIRLTFTDDKELVCTPKHKLLTGKEDIVYVQDVVIGDRLYGDVKLLISTLTQMIVRYTSFLKLRKLIHIMLTVC